MQWRTRGNRQDRGQALLWVLYVHETSSLSPHGSLQGVCREGKSDRKQEWEEGREMEGQREEVGGERVGERERELVGGRGGKEREGEKDLNSILQESEPQRE